MLREERQLKDMEPLVLPAVRAALADPPAPVASSSVASAWWTGVARGLTLRALTGLEGVPECAALADLFGDTGRAARLLEATSPLPAWGLRPQYTREALASVAYRAAVQGRWDGPLSEVEPWVSFGTNRGPGPIRPRSRTIQRNCVTGWEYRAYNSKGRLAMLAAERDALCVQWAEAEGGEPQRRRLDARIADVDAHLMSLVGVW